MIYYKPFKKKNRRILKTIAAKIPPSFRSALANLGLYPTLPDKETVIKSNYLGKYKVLINPLYVIERAMCRGNYEPHTSLFIDECVKPDFICLDIGTNVGALSFVMAKILERGTGKVYCFEPGPFFARLEENIKLNPNLKQRVIPYKIGLGNAKTTKEWREDNNNFGNATLLSDGEIKDNCVVFPF